jgi:hypothetical protein
VKIKVELKGKEQKGVWSIEDKPVPNFNSGATLGRK